MMGNILRKLIYFFFPTIKEYHKFLKSQTNQIPLIQYVKFIYRGGVNTFIGQYTRIAK